METVCGCISDPSAFIHRLHILFVASPEASFQLGFPERWQMFKSFDSKPWLHIIQMLFFWFWKRWNNVTLCCIQWERKSEPNREQAQTRQKWGQDETETQTSSRKGQKKEKKEAKALALPCQYPLPWWGRCVFTCSSSQTEKPRPVAFNPAEQYHSWLPGWQRACYPPSLHLPAPLLSTSLLLTPQASAFCLLRQASMFPGHHVTRKQAALFLFFLQGTGEDKQHCQQHRWGSHQAKRPDPENQMLSCQAECDAPAAPAPSCWWQTRSSILKKIKWTVIIS